MNSKKLLIFILENWAEDLEIIDSNTDTDNDKHIINETEWDRITTVWAEMRDLIKLLKEENSND